MADTVTRTLCLAQAMLRISAPKRRAKTIAKAFSRSGSGERKRSRYWCSPLGCSQMSLDSLICQRHSYGSQMASELTRNNMQRSARITSASDTWSRTRNSNIPHLQAQEYTRFPSKSQSQNHTRPHLVGCG